MMRGDELIPFFAPYSIVKMTDVYRGAYPSMMEDENETIRKLRWQPNLDRIEDINRRISARRETAGGYIKMAYDPRPAHTRHNLFPSYDSQLRSAESQTVDIIPSTQPYNPISVYLPASKAPYEGYSRAVNVENELWKVGHILNRDVVSHMPNNFRSDMYVHYVPTAFSNGNTAEHPYLNEVAPLRSSIRNPYMNVGNEIFSNSTRSQLKGAIEVPKPNKPQMSAKGAQNQTETDMMRVNKSTR